MRDFTGIKGSLVDLKMMLEMEGAVPFLWKHGSDIGSFDSKVVDRFKEGLRERSNDLIRVICYNFELEKFEIGELYYQNCYWDGDEDHSASPCKDSEDYKLIHRVLVFKTSDEDLYFHKVNEEISDENSNKFLELVRLGEARTFGEFDDNYTCWDRFYDFHLEYKDPYEDESCKCLNTGAYRGLLPIIYYVDMN